MSVAAEMKQPKARRATARLHSSPCDCRPLPRNARASRSFHIAAPQPVPPRPPDRPIEKDRVQLSSATALNSLGNFVGNTVSCGNRHGENAPFGQSMERRHGSTNWVLNVGNNRPRALRSTIRWRKEWKHRGTESTEKGDSVVSVALCFNRFGIAKQSGVITRIAVCCANRHSENPPLPQFVQSQRYSIRKFLTPLF